MSKLETYKSRAFGPPRKIQDSNLDMIVRTAGALSVKRHDGTGLKDQIPLFAISIPAKPDELYVLSDEELKDVVGEESFRQCFPEGSYL